MEALGIVSRIDVNRGRTVLIKETDGNQASTQSSGNNRGSASAKDQILTLADPSVERGDPQIREAAPELYKALKALSEHMDRSGGDAHGMPECPWCKAGPDGDDHRSECELVLARAALAHGEGRQP
jgi:hypothetical protein